MAVVGCGGGSVAIPSSYKSWNAKDGSFKLDYPDNWEASGGGRQGIQWAKFISGGAEIRVDTEVSGGLIGDILTGPGGPDKDIPDELAPVASVHEIKADALADEISGYKEEAPVKFTAPMGDGRKSAFSGSQGLGTKIRGYRATLLGRDKAIRIVCRCPEKYWDELQPSFDKILDSFAFGIAEQ
jgi:hypothetical protein